MKMLFFAPHSAIWVHAFPEALAAEALQQEGHQVVYVTCGEVLEDQCVAMNAHGMDSRTSFENRKRICNLCNANKKILRQRMGLRGYDMTELLLPEDYGQIHDILSKISLENYLRLEIDSVPVGRYALYELILNRKKNDLELNEAEWGEYQAAARGALFALFAGRRVLERERPERLVTYNSLYSVNRVVSRLAEARGIPSYFLHAGGNLSRRLQTLMLGRDHTLAYMKDLVAQWPRFRDRPCPPDLVRQITAHFLVLFGGESVFGYSPAAGKQSLDVRASFGVRESQRLLIATMSSPDERFAAQTIDALPRHDELLFATQADWIQALLDYVSLRPELFLLIRVHPREFPNKREYVRSHNAALLARVFETLPPNAAVNWPSDNIALYDLANYADVFLNAWSSAGKEMALLGMPVVVYAPELLFYPAELNYVGQSKDEFFTKIELALKDGWSIERSRSVHRWLAVEYGYGLIDIADGYRQKEGQRRTYADRVFHRIRNLIDQEYAQKRDCSVRSRPLARASDIEQTIRLSARTPLDPGIRPTFPAVDLSAEDEALRVSLARIGAAMFGNISERPRGPLAQRLAAIGPSERAA